MFGIVELMTCWCRFAARKAIAVHSRASFRRPQFQPAHPHPHFRRSVRNHSHRPSSFSLRSIQIALLRRHYRCHLLSNNFLFLHCSIPAAQLENSAAIWVDLMKRGVRMGIDADAGEGADLLTTPNLRMELSIPIDPSFQFRH